MLNIKKGRLLISEPSLIDPTFFKSVILITHHTADESIGLVLNQGTKISLNQLLTDIPSSDFPVYIGGPVERNSIQFIHTIGDIIPNSQEIAQGLYWGGDFEAILSLITRNKISKNHIRFFAGYSGWGADQLNHEIRENGWITHESNVKLCMKYSTKKLWSDLIKTKNEKYAIWANMPKNPSMN
ncbi:MAG: YqgE/AlgH family protein [Bacteroidota bacterium]|nr:YqgE/AlgH family protein [Bacteroidota bacterium]